MDLLKKENYWMWILILLFGGNANSFALGALLNVYDKNAWYAKPKNWILGLVCFIFPLFIMISIFQIEIMCKVNAKLNTPGKELYLSPYVWMACIIVPVIGWILLGVLIIYLEIWPIVMLHRGEGENI